MTYSVRGGAFSETVIFFSNEKKKKEVSPLHSADVALCQNAAVRVVGLRAAPVVACAEAAKFARAGLWEGSGQGGSAEDGEEEGCELHFCCCWF